MESWSHREEKPTGKPQAVSRRAILIGLLLIPPNAYWVMKVEGVWHTGHPSAMALFWNVMFCILVLILINLVIQRTAPRYALTQGEFITIFVMLNMVTALAGHDSLQLGIPAMSVGTWFATEGNRWELLFGHLLPRHLTVTDKEALKPFYEGHSTLYTPEHLRLWAGPVLWWTTFILALGLVLICFCVLIRKQWTENERLSYPIITLPLAITEGGGRSEFFKSRMLWAGIAIGAGLDILNGLHTLYPFIPGITVRHDARNWGQYFVTFPWRAIGWLPVPLYPFIIAMGYFLPLDLAFSIWFFYLFQKFQRVIGAIYGITDMGPVLNGESFGAWFAIFLYAMWLARHHIRDVLRKILWNDPRIDDREEAMRYRTAALGIIAGCAFIAWFCLKAGMTWNIIVPFFLIYFALAIAITRVRAELGPPTHEMAGGMNSGNLLVMALGTIEVGERNLVMVPLFYWFTGRGYRTQVMPPMLEALKMAERARVSPRGLGLAMLLGVWFGGLASYWAAIHLYYIEGKNVMDAHNMGQFNLLASWLSTPRDPDTLGMSFVGIGLVFTAFLMFMRLRFLGWPFHPAGFALSQNFGVDYFWMCLVISTVIKGAVLRYGGYRMYRQLMPLMFGVILGEYCVGAFWSVWSVVAGYRTYDFCPG